MGHLEHDPLGYGGDQMGLQIGYARTSTTEQVAGLDAQKRELEAAGCTRIFAEQISSVASREELEAAIDYLRDGDALVVTKLDRLARSMQDLLDIVDRVQTKKAGLRILSMNLDTSTATGRLILQIVGSIAEFERAIMLERQREGIAKAKAEGKYRGRTPTARRKADQVKAMLEEGVSPTEVARKLNIGRSSVYRAIADQGLKRQAAYTGEKERGR
jgi:DNA invertase Pin-like site-specific DNA recombinase